MARTRWLWISLASLVLLVGMLCARGGARLEVEPGSTLVVRVRGDYVEAAEPTLLARVLGGGPAPFARVLSQLALARRDDRLDAVVLAIEDTSLGWGKAAELRDAIGRLRAAGRRTVAYLELDGLAVQREYWIASAADEVWVVPGGSVPLVGLAAEYLYLGDAFDKLGVDFEVAKAGRYKSAVETIAGNAMSDASREMANALLDSTERQFVDGIARGRGLEPDAVRAAIDRAPVLASELADARLIDGEAHLDAVLEKLGGPVVKGEEYAGIDPASVGFDPVATYALVYGSGNVVPGDESATPRGEPVFAAGAIREAVEKAAKDDDVDAIIVRIDSPGGSALASEIMWRAISEAKRESGKPVVASFSDVAASGGYYVASAADSIVASGTTVTGSIGVFSLRPLLGGLLDKLGVRTELLTRGEHADFLSSTRPSSPAARERLQSVVLDIYRLFLERVGTGRSLATEAVDAVGQGRVWTGEQALERGLVDRLGGLHEAVREANRLRGIDEDADAILVAYPPPKPLAQELAELLNARIAAAARASVGLPALSGPLATLERALASAPPLAPLLVPPAWVEIR
ncbi:MAG: signal peptide peptidase SppA [Myxococcales bacterium]|nr:signal peptide peptidase SppA [Myxococcales bacterium]